MILIRDLSFTDDSNDCEYNQRACLWAGTLSLVFLPFSVQELSCVSALILISMKADYPPVVFELVIEVSDHRRARLL